jgi:nitric oxide reductase activation protein
MKAIAGVKVDEDLEKDLKKDLNEEVSMMPLTDAHKSCSFEIRRPAVTENYKAIYNNSCKVFSNIAKETARKVKPLLEMEERTDYVKNRFSGTRFNASSVVNNDYRYYSQLKIPGESPTLAVGLRVDESGSMGGCNRAVSARAAAITLWEFSRECQVPIGVYGDTADDGCGSDVSIFAYADFDKPDDNDRYRLMGIQARSNNRDGAAIQFVAERLLRTDADVKLLIIISDGQPQATGYHGSAAEKDMQSIVREYTRKGITFLAAAIGNDKDAIRRIYGADRFLDISNLEELPKVLTMLVKRHITN